MILPAEQLRQKAHELALTHAPESGRNPLRRLRRDFAADVDQLRAIVRTFQADRAGVLQPAEEWLLDNAEYLEEQALDIKRQLFEYPQRNIPGLKKSGEPRIMAICRDYLGHVNGKVEEDSFLTYVNGYQEVSVLNLSEAWTLPLMLRTAIIRELTESMGFVLERREAANLVERILAQVEPAKASPESLRAALDQAGQSMPLSGPIVVHLIRNLREWAEDAETVRDWLICRLENGKESLERMMSYEYQLQISYGMKTGNLVTSLRLLSRWDWHEMFGQVSLTEQTLLKESAGDYPRLDHASQSVLRKRVEQLARRWRVPENLVASQAVTLADRKWNEYSEAGGSASGDGPPPRQAYVSYYLLEPKGTDLLWRSLKTCSRPRRKPDAKRWRRPVAAYFQQLAMLFVLFTAIFAIWIGADESFSAWEWTAVAVALLFPASEWAVAVSHRLIELARPPRPLLRYDFSDGIPEEAATMVVIPVIWKTAAEVHEMADRLELHYLANRDPNIRFALLGDFKDSANEREDNDMELVEAAKTRIGELNEKYAKPGETVFYLFQRRRVWNPSEGVWMGWERKRGKLAEFVELLKGRQDTTYEYIYGDLNALPPIRYIITLDADTQLPIGTAQRMIGTIHLPYNRPRLNETRTRVAEGYGVLQPRIGISHEAAMRSRWASLISSEPGIDPYAFAVSDPYQDGVGQGIFTGKGIFDVDVFAEVLCDRIPENRVLSHDLLEGGFLRAGLLSDIELIDDQPATFRAFQKRLHRWVRGDWQLIIWLFPHAENRRGERTPVDLGGITRWQMIDNLRRSLSVPVMFVLLLLGLTVLPGSPMRWLALLAATLFMPLFFRILSIPGWMARPQRLLLTAGQAAVTVLTLPYQSAVLADAIVRTLYRLTVSKKRLLEWVSSAEVERASRAEKQSSVQGLYGGAMLIVLFVLATSAQFDPTVRWIGFVIGVFWAFAPLAIAWLDQPVFKAQPTAGEHEQRELRKLAEEIWAFFETYVTSKDNWLPPDNVQMEPPKGVAHRTSPTNIGLYLACTVAARDFGFIDTPGMIERIERTLSTIERMEKWKGHLYNWYETTTLKPLHPVYVSTVDSGNLASYLIAVKEGVAEWVRTDFPAGTEGEGRTASPMSAGRELNVAFAEELSFADVNKGNSERGEDGWASRGQDLVARLEKLIANMDFRPLYDHKAKLFSLGYYVSQNERDRILYDFIASEARQASFVAIALGQVSVAHWHALGRTMTKVGKHPAFLSWSGTMFEYLMPMLVMRLYPKTAWESTYRAIVDRQIGYARERGVPYGISESGYYAFDYDMNYQYRAFGVPGLGFKRGLEQDLVVAPYATVMSLPFAMRVGMETLRRLERDYGARGEYGFYEAIDFTPGRMPENRKFMVIKSYMAHHQGMSLLTLSNLLLPQTMTERFHRDKRVQAAELLLQERLPDKPKIIRHPALASVFRRETEPNPHHHAVHREYKGADTRTPQVCLLSNGTYTTVVTNSGGGFSMYEDLAVTRWREDPILDEWGSYIYIRDTDSDSLWSPTHNPCRIPPDEEQVRFMPDRAFFRRRHGDTETILEICVSPEYNAEVRRLTIVNNGTQTKQLEITTYCEPVLARPDADEAHPAFSKLFVLTEYEPEAECLLAIRKPRQESDRPRWAVHALIASDQAVGPLEYETDRVAFIGRGYRLADPRGIRGKLNGTVGSVADPAFVMRRRVTVEPGNRVQLFAIIGAAETKEEAVNLIRRFRADESVENTFRLAWNRSQIEFRHLQLTAAEANVFQMLAGYLLYTPPFTRERAESVAANSFGQSRLWSHGISGDRPVVVAHIEDRAGMPLAVKLLKGHEYLRRRGLRFDLVLINESAGGYLEDLQKRLQHAVEHSVDRYGAAPDGIYIVKAEQLSEADLNLLYAVSRAVLHTNGPSLLSQFKLPRERKQLPEPFVPSAPAERFPREEMPENGELLFFNGYGGFSPDGKEYRIQVKPNGHLPSPWINVLANPAFGTIVSELGTGYSWWRNSRECKLTPWSNDPVLDRPGEVCYLRDEESGEVWTPAPAILDVREPYLVSHGWGYTRFWHSRHGIVQEMTVSVPLEDPVKVIKLRLRNQTKMTRKLTVTYYAEWVLGVKRQETAPYIVTEWDSDARILLARNMYQETFRDATAFIGVYPQKAAADKSEDDRFDAGHPGWSWTGDRSEFLGRNGSYDRPAALGRMKLSGSTGAFYEPAGAVQAYVELQPGEETDVSIVLGCAGSRDAAAQLARKYSGTKECDRALEAVKSFWESVLGQIQVATPDPDTDVLLNGWLLYQTLCCRMWARTAFYQAGGAFGFRDQLQDSLALLHTRPDLTRAQIVLHASHQYKEGDVQHWWHEETERGIRTRFSDDLLWLPYAVGRYIAHTQDESVLEETAPFLHSDPLGENEHERYEETRLSGESGTIYEHCLRAIDRALSLYGEHGLPLIGIGDWNDGMSNLGAKGKGESVWLGWFLGVILEQFAGICAKKGDQERAERYLQARQDTFAAIAEHGWDGQWFRRAYSDAGQWMGSIHNAECRIDAIAQSWSVISGGAPKERQLAAMNSFDRELVDRNLSVVSLLTPPFEKTDPSPGYIQGYPPGIRENGGQYTHGVIWSITAWSLLGEGDKAYELFRMLNPVNHTRTPNEARRYAREPYAVAADVYTSEPHKGHAGWTWYTGAAGWLYQAGIESILGVRRSGSQLLLKPCIPAEWPGYTVKYRHGRSVYWIEVQNPHHKSAADEQSKLQADEGSSVISVQDEAGGKTAGESGFEMRIQLEDDGKEHRIILVL